MLRHLQGGGDVLGYSGGVEMHYCDMSGGMEMCYCGISVPPEMYYRDISIPQEMYCDISGGTEMMHY